MDRGYGFIGRDGEEKDLFFHSSSLQDVAFDDLKDGDTMQFEIETDAKGPRAINVTRV